MLRTSKMFTTTQEYCVTPTKQRPMMRLPERATAFMRDVKRRSLRVKQSKPNLVHNQTEMGKSDSFGNSQVWTSSRGVPEIHLGIVGSLTSRKSAMVHSFLNGTSSHGDHLEGGHFKKEIMVDGQSYQLLIRDEGGSPELQFTNWIDAIIFVFSLENEDSFHTVYKYFTKMSQCRNIQDVPMILVGTKDGVSESFPRLIDESRVVKLANDLKRCPYYETCSTFGPNIDKIFLDACRCYCQSRLSRSTTPIRSLHNTRPTPPNSFYSCTASPLNNGYTSPLSMEPPSPGYLHKSSAHYSGRQGQLVASQKENCPPQGMHGGFHPSLYQPHFEEFPTIKSRPSSMLGSSNMGTLGSISSASSLVSGSDVKFVVPSCSTKSFVSTSSIFKDEKDGATPGTTPTSSRKSRRRSNLFTPSKKHDDGGANGIHKGSVTTEMGSGRSIPICQGILHKKSGKSFSKDWKKKYVTLCDDGRMTYHPSLNDYMNNVQGKEIPLQYVTVKVPGQKPRGTRVISQTNSQSNSFVLAESTTQQTFRSSTSTDLRKGEKVTLTGYEMLRNLSGNEENNNADIQEKLQSGEKALETTTPNVIKRHQQLRMKGSGIKAGLGNHNQGTETEEVDGGFEFHIVSLDNKQWFFEANCSEERDEWVAAIEQQILNSLQCNESSKAKGRLNSSVNNLLAIKSIKSDIPGNTKCVDCDTPNPDWASINLGILMCIECSGVHRKLGSHISRVRSLDLDEWPPGHLAVMKSLGNKIANSIWEANLDSNVSFKKPEPNSSQEDKEKYIIAKYNHKAFLKSFLPNSSTTSTLNDAILRSDLRLLALVLAHATQQDVNALVNMKDGSTPLHLASSVGNLAIVQMLIWSKADVKVLDNEGRSCLTHLVAGNNELVELLVNNGCPELSESGIQAKRTGTISRKSDVSNPEEVT